MPLSPNSCRVFVRRALSRPLLPAGALTLAIAAGVLTGDARAGTGDLLGTKPGDLQNDGAFVDADTCTACHGGGIKGDKSFLPGDTWAGTMMANAARDPVYFAALSVANQDVPGEGTYCLHCHSPIGFVRGHATPPDASAFDSIDRQGVGCETCHRATTSKVTADPFVISDAQIFYDDVHSKRGPYPACDAQGMPPDCAESPAHEVLEEPEITSATFCGQCHQVTNPDRKLKDATGADTAFDFPLDTTFEEWKSSDYADGKPLAATCQGCHMEAKDGDVPVANSFGAPLRHDPPEHAFVGGNVWGIQAVMQKNPDRAALFPDAFQLAQDRTVANLGKAVNVTLTGAPTTGKAGDMVTVTVKVENLTGHKFPTGYAETRRAWIGLSLIDTALSETVLVGGYDLATGEISATPPTRIYRAQHGRWNGSAAEVESHLALHDMVVTDSRIPPHGFVAGPTTTPQGDIDFSDGKGGLNAFDQASFTVQLPANISNVAQLSARVYYQSMTKEYVDFLHDENTTDQNGEELQTIYQATNQAPPIVIASAESAIDFGSTTNGAGGASSTSSVATGSGAGGSGGSGGSDVRGGDAGCSCEMNGDRSGFGTWSALALVALIGTRRRRGAR